jgi:hypothetical protein
MLGEDIVVFVRIGKIFLVLALVTMIGAQWAALQTVAWTAMLADNLQTNSFHDAMTKTFDGKHPCCLCKAIAAAKQSEKKAEFSSPPQKLEFPPAEERFALIPPAHFRFRPLKNFQAISFAQKPLLRPPRTAFA